MKRYKIRADYDVAGYGTTEIEDPNGEWVKWDDVKDAVTAYNDWIDRGLWPVGSAVCNCEEMHESVRYAWGDGSAAEWFCPAHGYKKR